MPLNDENLSNRNKTQEYSQETKKLLSQLEDLIAQIDEFEKELLEQRALLKEVVEVQPTALWVLNQDGSIYVNNEKARQTRIDPKTISPAHNDAEIEIDDHFYLLQVSKQNGKTIITATDNTKNKRNERLIAMGQMAAHLAHEIRNPIGAAAILASTLFDKVDIRAKSIVLEIKKSIWRVERIVKATLLFSKGFTLNPKRFNFRDLIAELESGAANYSYSKAIEFNFNLPDEVINADFDLIALALHNMIFNAIDAIEESENEEGAIAINCVKDGEIYALEIVDSGKPFENNARLFEAFYTSKTKGHGLGLILTRQIIEAHGGSIALLDGKKGFLARLPSVVD
ncbi:MAG: HAMP domain-containing histidine kinase [Helicobacteraceae bacterium]|jgi:signal transduction histidine kinase|nr:HAMP domain-containing histidine kinase [Helicobacteraceae bacterium]